MRLTDIKMVVCDVDGTLTDGGMYITETGDHFKRFHTRDGRAISVLRSKGIVSGMISHSIKERIVSERAQMLDVPYCYVGLRNKKEVLDDWLNHLGLTPQQVAFLGDDSNDLEVMQYVGISVCPADAHASIKNIAKIVLTLPGGAGCLREFVDNYL